MRPASALPGKTLSGADAAGRKKRAAHFPGFRRLSWSFVVAAQPMTEVNLPPKALLAESHPTCLASWPIRASNPESSKLALEQPEFREHVLPAARPQAILPPEEENKQAGSKMTAVAAIPLPHSPPRSPVLDSNTPMVQIFKF